MKVRLTKRAADDLGSIADYLNQRSHAGAVRVRDAILNSLEVLALFPRAGRRQSIAGVRKVVTRRYSYIIYYTVDDAEGEVRVLTIQHPALNREFSDM